MAEQQPAGERHAGIYADHDIDVSGSGNILAGGHLHIDQLVQQAQPPAPWVSLPPDMTNFTGRNTEQEQLEAELLAGHSQAVMISAIHGKPGVGKSALAVHLAHRLAGRFPDGQLYFNLRGADQQPVESETALTELLYLLGVPSDQHAGTLHGNAGLWRRNLAGKRVLVVLDNAHDEAQVRPLLPGSSTCSVIVTSRRVLATLGTKSLSLDTLEPGEALELLGKVAESGERVAAEPQAALAVLAACGGLPLALCIAGARLKAQSDWPIAKLADRLADERRRLAELGVGDLDVRASFQLSYQDLDNEQARLFRLLSLWPGLDFHPWVAAALLGLSEKAAELVMDGLVLAQLLEPTTVSGRLRIHDLLRLFAREQLDHEEADSDWEVTRVRLLEVATERARTLDVFPVA